MIISVGYRVNSYEATQFRIWPREVLKLYIIEGFVMDDERLKGQPIGGFGVFLKKSFYFIRYNGGAPATKWEVTGAL